MKVKNGRKIGFNGGTFYLGWKYNDIEPLTIFC